MAGTIVDPGPSAHCLDALVDRPATGIAKDVLSFLYAEIIEAIHQLIGQIGRGHCVGLCSDQRSQPFLEIDVLPLQVHCLAHPCRRMVHEDHQGAQMEQLIAIGLVEKGGQPPAIDGLVFFGFWMFEHADPHLRAPSEFMGMVENGSGWRDGAAVPRRWHMVWKERDCHFADFGWVDTGDETISEVADQRVDVARLAALVDVTAGGVLECRPDFTAACLVFPQQDLVQGLAPELLSMSNR